ncbi:beta-lactamase [Thalassotalea insulae]|uniref:beta-lactamase n=1 Tax=Thalassotalea insulae TaxID=2056778 RepID=A0ABQ6GY66_9GAMM|nr:subclass B1 metallo-beta-lactamase [Thalassotalea insulae]GLX80269.1 beta-lactamase [Thalassotalea insulae]
MTNTVIKALSTLFFLIIFNSGALAKEQTLEISPLTEDVYQFISYLTVEPWGRVGASGLLVKDGSDVYMIDTPWTEGDTRQLVEWIQSKALNLRAAVATHFHRDASGGIKLLNQLNIPTYATQLTNELMVNAGRENANHQIDTEVFQLLKDRIEVFYPGAGHSQDNIVVWLSKEQMLFGGCLVRSLGAKTMGNIADASIEDWAGSIEHILQRYSNIKQVIPGHGQVGSIELLLHTKSLATMAKQKLAIE